MQESDANSVTIDNIVIEEIPEPSTIIPTNNQIIHGTFKTRSGRNVTPKQPWSPSKPGQSGLNVPLDTEIDSEDESEPCCICGQQSPPSLKSNPNLVIVKWVKCSHNVCTPWVHLQFCHPKTSVGKNEHFLCPCCENSQSEM